MEILLFRSLETDVCDQWLLIKKASNRITQKQKNTEENKGNYRALRNALSHLWRRMQHSLVRQIKGKCEGKTLNWYELEANTLLWVCYVHTPAAQPCCTSTGQGWLRTHTQPARWILQGRCTMDGWAANISWAGKCLFPHVLATWDHRGREISLPDQCLLLSVPHTHSPQAPGMWWPQQQQTVPQGTVSWPPLLPAETSNFSKGRSLLPSEQGCRCSWGRGRLLSAIPQLTRSCWIGASLNDPVMADTGVCRSNTRHIYWQGWLCFCKGCAQAVAGWKANKHFPEKAWWMKWTEH